MRNFLSVIITRWREISCFLLFTTTTFATPHYGFHVNYLALSQDPASLDGGQLMLIYDPDRFQWRQFNLYFDGGVSYFHADICHHSTLTIYSVAPVARYTFKQRGPFQPYLDLSIGLAYLNHTRLDHRNLGMHMAFQDRFGIGVSLGTTHRLAMGIEAVHYSNADLAAHNSGLSLPLMLDVSYRFE